MTTGPPSDDELCAQLAKSLDENITILERHPYEYATSFPLDEIVVDVDGERRTFIYKDLRWDRLLPAAAHAKPAFLHDPRRAVQAQSLVAPGGFAPAVHAAGDDWIVMDKVAGVELWQVGEHETWWAVARWLARFHRHFADDLPAVRAAGPQLLRHDEASYRRWADRATEALGQCEDPRAAELMEVLDGYGNVVARLTMLPPVLVHGELFPSNVLVGEPPADRAAWAVDWEMAAIGPAALDLAALGLGWDEEIRGGFVDAYEAEWSEGAGADLGGDVDRCVLHLSLQWLGWSDGWEPPAEHRRDWIGEALAAAERLGL